MQNHIGVCLLSCMIHLWLFFSSVQVVEDELIKYHMETIVEVAYVYFTTGHIYIVYSLLDQAFRVFVILTWY